ncbi:ATPase [Pseudoalteromonas luteoviolacea]|uniref:ATPase n=1 Tax=Pseudoalteromonas luteoviolacea TaxID=43657 RepID=A0A0C1Q643_9GAMM|nr:type VI secretion system ATPase TssH [Pseudoalteromonas luteoviolacea]KID56056.1 ATPase [Pseudoalteromonas luteoviolacea]
MDATGIKQLIDKLNAHTASALEAAAGFAASRQHYEVLPEHLLLKLMEDHHEGDVAKILPFFEIDQDTLWHEALGFINQQDAANQGKPVFSRRLYELLERAWLTANVKHCSEWITGAALLDAFKDLVPFSPAFGLARELDKLDIHFLKDNLDKICKGSTERMAFQPVDTGRASTLQQNGQDTEQTALDSFCEDLTAKAASGGIDPVLGRSEEIRLAIDVLCRRRKNNPIFVGDPGVGKTAVVEGLAQRIVAKTVPDELVGVRIMVLDMGLLQAGAGVKGEFERRLKQVIDDVKSSSTPIILFIDEAHTLIGAGGDAGMGDAANLLKPALARGELRTLAATTWSEYKQYFERDAALERRFQLIKVDEPSEHNAKLMLSGIKEKYEQHHQIHITDSAIEAAVSLSARYITGRQLPDKAIDVLDTAAAAVRMGAATSPVIIENAQERVTYLTERLVRLEQEAELGIESDVVSAELAAELDQAQSELAAMQARRAEQLDTHASIASAQQSQLPEYRRQLKSLNEEGNAVFCEVDQDTVAQVIANWTGIPVGNMVKDELQNLLALEQSLGAQVVGQEQGLSALAQSLRVAKAGVSASSGPLGVFLFSGPSGVGKTETARHLANVLFGGDKFLTTINMSEYQESHTVSQLKGSPPGYVGYGEGGVLTEAVRQRPYSVVLLDEVEKAHPDVLNMFYQVFELGMMRDGEGREIDFKNTVIIMTSNIAAEQIAKACRAPNQDDEDVLAKAINEAQGLLNQQADETPTADEGCEEEAQAPWTMPSLSELNNLIKPELLNHFAPALLARMQVIPFKPLDSDALENIVALKLEKVAARLSENHQITLRVDQSVLSHLSKQCALSDSGARLVNATIEQQILPGVARSILGFLSEEDMPDLLTLTLNDDGQIEAVFADLA